LKNPKRKIDMYSIKNDNIVYYFRTLQLYNEAQKKINKYGVNTVSTIYMADVVVDTKKNEIIKCRYMMEEIVNGFFETSMLISE
jgi:hypothetical protein